MKENQTILEAGIRRQAAYGQHLVGDKFGVKTPAEINADWAAFEKAIKNNG